MAIHKSISHILEDYKLKADNFRRGQESMIRSDKVLKSLDEKVRTLGMKMIEQELSGNPTDLMRNRLEQLNDQRARRISETGGRKYLCSLCQDTGITGNDYCTCLRGLIYREHYGAYDPLKSTVTLDTYDMSILDDEELVDESGDTQRSLTSLHLRACRELLERLPGTTHGLFIHGEPGLGKSWLAGALARSAAEKGIDTAFIHSVPMFSMYHRERLGQDVDMSYLETAKLLIVDDLGAEPMTANVTVEALLRLLTIRMESGLPSVLVSNQTDLHRKYGERISSRIYGSDFLELVVQGKDLRKERRKPASDN